MMKRILFLFLLISVIGRVSAQKILSEGTVSYDVTVQTGTNEPKMADMFDGAKATLMLKGTMSRSELSSALGSTSTIYDHKSGTGVVLRDFGTQKLLIKMNRSNWADKNKKFNGIVFNKTGETKTIAGYKCEKAEAVLKDGSSFTVYYAVDIVPENGEYDAQFKNLPGLPLEYESTQGKMKIKYTVSKISFDPVPVSKFEVPKSGYREMTYEESVKKPG